uniref:Uncharacterized protein n=1 Tax=Panagrolaimus sp. ES5 TaxID=591445 RepID=A0AC34FAV7_9BILA
MTTIEWLNNSDEYIETYPTATTFQYINEDTCTSTTTTTTADNFGSGSGDDTAEHAETILNYFQQLYYTQKGIDLEIFVNGKSVAKVHRIIIAAFLRILDPIIDENNVSSLFKLDIPNTIGVSIDDLREIINFLYTGKIFIKNKSILKSLEELGCNHILPLLYNVLEDDGDEDICETLHGIEVKCHRYCIAAFSKIVEDSLQEVENTQIIYLEITELESASIKAVNQLVTFIYSNTIPTNTSDFVKLKETALIFGVERLVKKLPKTPQASTSAPTQIKTYEEEYYEESTSYFDDQDSNSTSEAAPTSNPNLTDEKEYVNIYNQYVEGPMTAACSSAYDPSVEYLNATKSVKTTVSKILRYKCPLCSFASTNRGTIRKHLRCIHTHETPYSCPQCFMTFKIQSNLARHLRSHSQIKPYKCKSCGSEYADKKNMDAHIFREHLKREPFRCPHNCAKAKFYREDSWRRHCQKFHSILPQISFPSDLSEDGNSQNCEQF